MKRTNQQQKDCIRTERKGAQKRLLLSEILYKHLPHRRALNRPLSLVRLNQGILSRKFFIFRPAPAAAALLDPWPAHQEPAVHPRNFDSQNAPTLSNAPMETGGFRPWLRIAQRTQSKSFRVSLLPSRFCPSPKIYCSKGTGASRGGPHSQSWESRHSWATFRIAGFIIKRPLFL